MRPLALFAWLCAAMSFAPPAGAVTITLGPTDLSASDPFGECELPCPAKTFIPTSVPGGVLVTPGDGIVTSWRVKGTPAERLRLRIVRPVGAGEFRGIATLGTANYADGIAGNPAEVRIAAGDQVGIDVTSNFPSSVPSVLLGDPSVPGASWSGFSSGLADQETSQPTESGIDSVPMFNATVELFKPLIVHMTSTSGPSSGGDIVVVTGHHLAVLGSIEFGSVQAAVIKADNEQVIAVAPPHQPGVVEVTVETAGGSSIDSLADRYRYLAPTGPVQGPDLGPRLWALTFSPPTFEVTERRPTAGAAAAAGTVISYQSSEAARAKFTVQRRVEGRYLRVRGAFVHKAVAGPNALRFTGRIRDKRLAPGSYRLLARAVDAGGKHSRTIRRSFRIVR